MYVYAQRPLTALVAAKHVMNRTCFEMGPLKRSECAGALQHIGDTMGLRRFQHTKLVIFYTSIARHWQERSLPVASEPN